MWKTGHSLIKDKMKELNVNFAGEMSGHIFFADDFFGYQWHRVGENQIGIVLDESRVVDVKQSGIYSDPFNKWADVINIKIEGIQFCAEDPEVLTKDKQRIGLRVCGTVHRPNANHKNVYLDNWSQYRGFYTSDEALVGITNPDTQQASGGLMSELAYQSMKVCVGDKNFEEAVVGSSRDDLRVCINDEMNKLALNYGGLEVRNLTVPNVIIGEQVQGLLDQITQAKFETSRSEQQALKAKAEADRLLAERQGEIRVEQGQIQEKRRQEAITADLERQSLEAQAAVIDAQKANDLQAAKLDEEIAKARLKVSEINAQAALANEAALATLLSGNQGYLQYMMHMASTKAWQSTDKLVVPAGASFDSVLNPQGDVNAVVDLSSR